MRQKFIDSIWKQPEGTFIKMASLKIDFYFEVFKQLKNHDLSYLTGVIWHKDTEFTKTNG